jgi:hypothetical protein
MCTPEDISSPFAAREALADPSGRKWVHRFPTSVATGDLAMPFRACVETFNSALRAAGATVTIAATLRDPKRAYLMHWAWRIVRQNIDPLTIHALDGVNIRWAHEGPDGKYSRMRSVDAAREMVCGYDMLSLGAAPALNSRHTKGCAIDMSIRWDRTLSILDSRGERVEIATTPRSVVNTQLARVGESFGVIKYNRPGRDDPHWSDNGAYYDQEHCASRQFRICDYAACRSY